jgi:hypothetical protein
LAPALAGLGPPTFEVFEVEGLDLHLSDLD